MEYRKDHCYHHHFAMARVLLLLLIGLGSAWANTREVVADVREGQDVTLKCRFNNPSLLSAGGQIYWLRQSNGETDNVAIADTPFARNYKVDLVPEEGRYDLTISRATYERDNGMFECRVKEAGTGSDLHTTTVNLTVLIPPGSPRIDPETPTATEGQPIDLVCSSQGGSPDPQIIWYRSGSEQKLQSVLKPGGGRDFATTSVLTINPGKDDDGAQYRCVIWNRALTDSEKMEAAVTLSVNYYPRITIGPENPLRVELDHSATLTCTADAKPPVSNVRWTRGGRFIGTVSSHKIERVSLDDAGRYVCQADNGLGRLREAEVTLDVLYGPRVSVISSKDVDEGEDVVISCNVTANPAPFNIEWLKEGDDSFRQSGLDILRLSRVSAVNQGNYVCRAVSMLNPTDGESSDRIGNATVAVRVRHAPGKTYILPKEPIAVQGEQATLTCGADPPGWPMPTYRWWRHDSEATLTLGANYTIPRASLADEGTYYCQPSNRLGKGTHASVTVKVHEPPRILEDLPETAIHRIGKTDLSLTCRAQGKPQPSIRWLKDGEEINPADGLYNILVEQSSVGQNDMHTVQSTLQFRGPRRINDNQLLPTDRGTYQCVFKNDVREVSSSQLLRVEHSPITVHKPNKVAFDLAEDAELECRMQAYPEPRFQWSLGPNFIESDGTHYSVNDTALPDDVYASVLTIKGVTEADYGSYTCKGTNTRGDHKTIITLQEKGRPEHPTNLQIINQGTNFIELGWDESFNGGFPNTLFHVQAETMSGEIMSHDCQSDNPCIIEPLPQQTAFKLQVQASNMMGDSDFSDPLEAMTLIDVDTIPEPEEVYFERTSHHVSFRVLPTDLMLQAQVELKDSSGKWTPMEKLLPINSGAHDHAELYVGEDEPEEVRIRFCSVFVEASCGNFRDGKKVDYLPSMPSQSMTMPYMVAIIVSCVVFVALIALIFVCCCCCRRRNNKLKNKTADMEVSHRSVVTQQAPPPPYYTVGMDNKGLDGSMDTGLDDPSKTAIYSSQQYHNYSQNGHINNAQNNNAGMGYMDNSYSNSNNGGSVNSQDSLWQVKGHGDPQMTAHMSPHMSQDSRGYQYDPMVHGGYGISGYDDYSHYPAAGYQGHSMMEDYPGSRNNYSANGDPYNAVHKQRKRVDHIDGDVSGMPDPYMEHYEQGAAEMNPENKPQISFDESLESGYSTPNSRNRRIIREIIV